METIVVTGGPRGAKSTVMRALRQTFRSQIEVVPEVATGLLRRIRKQGFFPMPGTDLPWSREWQDIFQELIALMQPRLEQSYALRAEHRGARVLACDRGLLDGAAYTPGGVSEFCRRHGIVLEEALSCYALVIHLESTATGAPEEFLRDLHHSNAARIEAAAFEDLLKQSQELEYGTRAAWQEHPNWHFISCEGGVAGKIAAAHRIVRGLLP